MTRQRCNHCRSLLHMQRHFFICLSLLWIGDSRDSKLQIYPAKMLKAALQ
uniref:Uncharacterized protein n=1 Tax=Rhizophora mucronata TaxID=61149 RepID=A0A2P2QYV6_RHIMU